MISMQFRDEVLNPSPNGMLSQPRF